MLSVCLWFLISQILLIQQSTSETRFCSGAANPTCTCTNPGLCTLQCHGKDHCKDTLLECRAGHPCNVICNSDGEESACEDTIIDGSLATTVNVVCHDRQACLNARVHCGTHECAVLCLSTDSTGSNCKGLHLNCAGSQCSIECESGPNMCANVRIATLSSTKSFECVEPGLANNNECQSINAIQPPFTRTTAVPTLYTLSPSNTPSNVPSNTPTNVPTNPTLNPSLFPTLKPSNMPTLTPSNTPTFITKEPSLPLIPTHKPSLHPSDIPSFSPLMPGTPTKSNTASPTQTPSFKPTNMPITTAVPTVPQYRVISELTDVPTRNNPNIYAENSVANHGFMQMIITNRLYLIIAAICALCCAIVMCIRCCKRDKKLAKPARYEPGQNRKKQFIHVKSSSNLRNKIEFVPPPPLGPPPVQSKKRVRAEMNERNMSMNEGINAADVALPGTLRGVRGVFDGDIGTNMNVNIKRERNESGSDDGMEISEMGNEDIELLNQFAVRV